MLKFNMSNPEIIGKSI